MTDRGETNELLRQSGHSDIIPRGP